MLWGSLCLTNRVAVYEKRKLFQEEFEDTKGVIRICKSKKDRQHNGQKEKNKTTYQMGNQMS
jgi:hypothetical protein